MNYIKPLLYILSIAALFLIDLGSMLFFQQPFFQSVLCFYIVRLFNKPTLLPLLIAIFFIHLEWFIMYDSMSLATLFILPVTALVFYLKRVLVPRMIYPTLVLILCLALQTWFIHLTTGQPFAYNAYTISAFFANIMVLLSNSLIW